MLKSAFNFILKMHKRSGTIERLGGNGRASGLNITLDQDLEGIISEGVVYINGVRLEIDPFPFLSLPQEDTYFDIDSTGDYVVTGVANNAPEPVLAPDSLRIAKVVSDLIEITSFEILSPIEQYYAINATPIEYTPANYSRKLAGPEEITIDGKEFVISKQNLERAKYPVPIRGDRIVDSDIGLCSIAEVKEMFDFGGELIGYRVRSA